MKGRTLCLLLATCTINLGRSQTSPDTTDTANSASASGQAAQFIISARSAHSRTWSAVTWRTNAFGQAKSRTNAVVTELRNGICYRDEATGDWTDASDQIVIQPTGGALAQSGQTRFYVPASLYSDTLECRMSSGGTIVTRPIGLALSDGQTNVLIAELRDGPVGQLLPSGSAVIWTNICTDLRCDLLVENLRCGYEASLIIREKFDPGEWGFADPSKVRVQWLTEFFSPPPVTATPSVRRDGLVDTLVDFGELLMAQGKGFLLGTTGPGVPVYKQWVVLDGGARTVLLEEIPWMAISDNVQQLAPHVASGVPRTPRAFSEFAALPRIGVTPAGRGTNTIVLAQTDSLKESGFLLDYNLSGSLTNFTFKGGDDGTYVVGAPGAVNLRGTTVIEGNAVIKFTNDPTAKLVLLGPLVTKTGPGRMAVLTSQDDDSVGTALAASTHSPTNFNGGRFISSSIFGSSTFTNSYRYLRFAYAGIGLELVDDSKDDVWHCQFVQCGAGLDWCDDCMGAFYGIHNALFAQCGTVDWYGGLVFGEHVTVDGGSITACSGCGFFTNSIFTGATNLAGNVFDHCATNASAAGFYAPTGGGGYYLAPFSTNRLAGTTNTSPALLSDLSQKTTYPPIIAVGDANAIGTTLYPRAQREDRNAPDIGYGYDAVDYAMAGVFLVTNGTLTVTPGTCIAVFNTNNTGYGVGVGQGAKVVCTGTPIAPCRFVEYTAIQEQRGTNWTLPSYALLTGNLGYSAPAGFNLRFVDFSVMARDVPAIYSSAPELLVQDCQFHGGLFEDFYSSVHLTNCLFERVDVELEQGDDPHYSTYRNNLFRGGSFYFMPWDSTNSVIKDNLFDGTAMNADLTGLGYAGAWNAYVTTNYGRILPATPTDIILTNSPAYQTGPLGAFYLPTNSILINADTNTTADQVGLYHYCTTTNQVRETNSLLDVSFHYVAVTNGLPFDTDGGGAPDYLENTAGDGNTNNVGETNWKDPSDDVNYLVQPGYLRCEYRVDPWGVDAKDPITGKQKPRLFWILTSGHRAAKQLAYQVLVATDTNNLALGFGDMWDSGIVLSDQTIHVEYNGSTLQCGQRLWWKVRSWDQTTGIASPWSTNGFFQMGLLYPSNWTAQWLTTTVNPGTNSPMYRHDFIQRTNDIKRATAYVTAKGVYELWLDGQRIGPNLLAPEWTYYNQRIQYQTFDVTTNLMTASTDGTNHAVGGIIAEGWYSGRESIDDPSYPTTLPYTNSVGGRKQFLLQLTIERTDGSVTNIVTDSSWSCTISNGPIQGSSIWDGETYAVTNEGKVANWSTFSYGGESTFFTNNVTSYAVDASILAAQPSDPIRIVQYISPIDVWTNTAGGANNNQFVRIFDMGQNMAGWCTISLVNTNQPAGTQITVRHAEVLKLDAQKRQVWGTNISIDSLSTLGFSPAQQTEVYYIQNTSSTQQLQPHFTYHGFRFVEVATPTNIVLDLNSVTGCVIRSVAPGTGDFWCSHRDVSQLMTNILWTLRANLQGIETDCPQRNERFGWLGDSDAFSQTACFMTDMSALYTRIIRDIRDGQNINGYAGTIYFGQYQVNNPFAYKAVGDVGWSAGGVIKPWGLYQNYADVRMLTEHYLSASNWIVFFTNINWPNFRFDNPAAWNGNADVLNGADITFDSFGTSPARMSHPVHNYSFYAHSADLLAKMSLALANRASVQGNSSAASVYNANYAAYTNIGFLVRSNFQRSVSAVPAGLITYDATGTNVTNIGESLHTSTQGDYAYALYFNMVPDTQRSNCAYLLLNASGSGVHKYYSSYTDPFTTLADTNHLSTGIQGTMRAMLELTRNGYTADAYSLLLDYRFPSWLHQITNSGTIYSVAHTNYGATTCWERWDGLVSRAGGGYNGGYNSFNHFWAGSVGEWIYRNVAGINRDDNSPGFQNAIIEPQPGGGITNALGSFKSIHGPITCSWTNDTSTTNFSLNVTIPANATASVYILGATNIGSITESGGQATNAPGLLYAPIVTNGAALLQIGSGSYQFKAPVKF